LAAALPSAASAEEQTQPAQPILSALLGDLVAVPAATLPSASLGVTLAPTEPARPADSASDPTPQAYIKKRVVLRTFRGTVRSVDAASAQIVVRTKHRRPSGRVVVRRQTFGLTGARLTVIDTNGDGVVTIADIQRGDRVRLRAAVGRGPLRTAVPLATHDLVDKGQSVHAKRRGRKLRSSGRNGGW
jgi:hypothetical protein